MAKIIVIEGEIGEGEWRSWPNRMTGPPTGPHKHRRALNYADISDINIEETWHKKEMKGSLGWGAFLGLSIGPVGALIGSALGGNKQKVLFSATDDQGEPFKAVAYQETFAKIQKHHQEDWRR